MFWEPKKIYELGTDGIFDKTIWSFHSLVSETSSNRVLTILRNSDTVIVTYLVEFPLFLYKWQLQS